MFVSQLPLSISPHPFPNSNPIMKLPESRNLRNPAWADVLRTVKYLIQDGKEYYICNALHHNFPGEIHAPIKAEIHSRLQGHYTIVSWYWDQTGNADIDDLDLRIAWLNSLIEEFDARD